MYKELTHTFNLDFLKKKSNTCHNKDGVVTAYKAALFDRSELSKKVYPNIKFFNKVSREVIDCDLYDNKTDNYTLIFSFALNHSVN